MLPQPAQHTAPLADTNPPIHLACYPLIIDESAMTILLLRQSYFDPTAQSSTAQPSGAQFTE